MKAKDAIHGFVCIPMVIKNYTHLIIRHNLWLLERIKLKVTHHSTQNKTAIPNIYQIIKANLRNILLKRHEWLQKSLFATTRKPLRVK